MSKRASIALAALCIFGILFHAKAEEPLVCYDGPFDNVMLDGCVDDCKSFETLAEAEEHCNSLELCGGITKSAYGDQEAINLGVGLYEVRQGPGIEASKGDTTWIKQVDCEPALAGAAVPEAPFASEEDKYVDNVHQYSPEELDNGDVCYTYSASVQGKYLEGCVDECASFPTLQEAQDHCDQIPDCGGVTHSLYGEGQVWHNGNGPYEVRLGPTLKASVDGDISWIRLEHPCNEGGAYDWNQNLELSEQQAGGSLLQSLVYLIVLFGLFGGAVFASYRMGHQITIDYVDRARDKLRELMDRRGPRQTGGAYETL